MNVFQTHQPTVQKHTNQGTLVSKFLTNCHFVLHNTTNNTSSSTRHHDPPRPSASSGFKIIGECDRPTSHGDAQYPQHGNAIFIVKVTLPLFYNYLFHAQLIRVHASKRCVFKVNICAFISFVASNQCVLTPAVRQYFFADVSHVLIMF